MNDEQITPKFWNGIKVLGAVFAAIAFMLGGLIAIIKHENAPVLEVLARMESKQDAADRKNEQQDILIASNLKRSEINSACSNGVIGFVNRKYKVSLMKPYDLFEKPKEIELEND